MHKTVNTACFDEIFLRLNMKKVGTLNMLCPLQMNRLFYKPYLYRACKSLNMKITLFLEFNKICFNRAKAGKRDVW